MRSLSSFCAMGWDGWMNEKAERLEELIRNWRTYCIEENFIGIGSSMKVYRAGENVIKCTGKRTGICGVIHAARNRMKEAIQ